MASPFDLQAQLECFDGTAPLFPLPGTVLFPHILLPLHIFEPRYRRMTADVLAGNRLLAMAHPRPASDTDVSDDCPPIAPTVCLGRVVAEERLPDGRFYLVLQGMSRARVLSEPTGTGLPYRVGQLQLLSDHYPPVPKVDRERHWDQILGGFRAMFPDVPLDRMFLKHQAQDVPLGVLCDVLAYAMKPGTSELQRLLEELDVDTRSARIIRQLQKSGKLRRRGTTADARNRFPPQFSVN